ncbi:hypothetical protein AB7645_16310 [Bradyrhizobium sp. 956_D2_N1_5]|uniref:hypothetical protein n=1 Tax=unclassified Bradyrhizobium TaxID=2631580 RepID=UPI003F28F8C3
MPPKKLAHLKFLSNVAILGGRFWSMRLMSDVDFPVFDSSITRRGRGWRWCVSGEAGKIVLQGTERSRPAAQYMAARATFLLLLTAPYWRPSNVLLPVDGYPVKPIPTVRPNSTGLR